MLLSSRRPLLCADHGEHWPIRQTSESKPLYEGMFRSDQSVVVQRPSQRFPWAKNRESHPGHAVAGIDVNGLARNATGQVTQEERSSATHFHLGDSAT